MGFGSQALVLLRVDLIISVGLAGLSGTRDTFLSERDQGSETERRFCLSEGGGHIFHWETVIR